MVDDVIKVIEAYSNTTLVKVKYKILGGFQKSDLDSNTTLVKVKYIFFWLYVCVYNDSNTTLVKVKLIKQKLQS